MLNIKIFVLYLHNKNKIIMKQETNDAMEAQINGASKD